MELPARGTVGLVVFTHFHVFTAFLPASPHPEADPKQYEGVTVVQAQVVARERRGERD